MKLDYINRINEFGDKVVRLYDFNKVQATAFRDAVYETIIVNKEVLDLASLNFIESRNCYLILCISDEDIGIETINKGFLLSIIELLIEPRWN